MYRYKIWQTLSHYPPVIQDGVTGRVTVVFQTPCNPTTPPSSYPIGAQGMPKQDGVFKSLATSGSTVGASRRHPNPNQMHLSWPRSAPTFLTLRYLRT